jgi:hypothetical protein
MVMSNAEAMREKERRQRTAPSVRQSPSNQRGPELLNFNFSDAKLANGGYISFHIKPVELRKYEPKTTRQIAPS